jgi:NAD(P)-dependent dehydrogenase (short-subunit alcohol dehydrogenase family)
MSELKSKVAVVTGGAQGIGHGVAVSLAENGAQVVLWDVTEHVETAARDLCQKGFKALAQRVDVTDRAMVQSAVAEINRRSGPVDILVNNAGIAQFAPFLEMAVEDRDAVLNVNLNGTWNCSQAVLGDMLRRGFGRIINIASVTGPRVGDPGLCAYAASKAAICGLSRNLAVETASHGVTVNAVLPGFIDTELMQPLADQMGISVNEARRNLAQANPTKRLGTVADIGSLCVFLASEASGYITGQEFVIDGGGTVVEK